MELVDEFNVEYPGFPTEEKPQRLKEIYILGFKIQYVYEDIQTRS